MGIRMMVSLLALSASCLSSAAVPPTQVVMATWQVKLDAAGRVTDIAARSSEIPALYSKLEPLIRDWRFSPGRTDGQGAETQTYLMLTLQLTTKDDKAEVRVLKASTGGDYGHLNRPAYPESAARSGREGGVLLRVHYDGSGAVTSAEPYGGNRRVDDRLVQAARSSVKKWTFLPEVVAGHAIAADVLVPICYQLSSREPASCRHANPSTGQAMGDLEAVALDPVAKLETDVIGHAL